MKTSFYALFAIALSLFLMTGCNKQQNPDIQNQSKSINKAQYDILYESGNWDHPLYKHSFTSFGNHRIVVEVNDPAAGMVQLIIPWRRNDLNPEEKAVLIQDAVSGDLISEKKVLNINNEEGHLIFMPTKESSHYYVYYLPHRSTGGYYPQLTYIKPCEEPDDKPATAFEKLSKEQLSSLPQARVISAQSIDDFHSFYPMEIIATSIERENFIKEYPAPYYLFPEYREHPIKMDHFLPLRWAKSILHNGLMDTVRAGEYFTFQTGLWSPNQSLSDIDISFSDLIGKNDRIPAEAWTCFNTEGIDLNGEAFSISLSIPKNKVQALWFGIDINSTIKDGSYSGHVIVKPEGIQADTVFLTLRIYSGEEDKCIDNPQNMSRLKWLNSTIGSGSEYLAPPFIPIEVTDKTIRLLGREIELNPLGFPSGIYSYFSQEMTHLNANKESILSGPIGIEILDKHSMPVMWTPGDYTITQIATGIVQWEAEAFHEYLTMNVKGQAEYDGTLNYKVQIIAKEDQELENISLSIPLMKQAAEYMLGLGYKGCKRPENIDWKWDVQNKHQEGAWLGTVNKGLQYVLRDKNYERPLNTNFYRQKPLKLPASWANEGKGGIRISTEKTYVNVENYSGSRELMKGDTLNFNVRFLITPFKVIDTKSHFNTRFVHKYAPIDSVVAWNGTVVNVHHANEINPYINYPFYKLDKQKAYIDEAHEKGIKVKLYNTIRELTYKAYELFALKSLGDEILNDGKGGGHSWLQEHMSSNYHSAWHATSVNDAAILNKGSSRWTNYYIEGINWLAENQQIDGLYLDDIAFSRTTVKRLSNVLHSHRDEVVIDLHSANQFNARDGYINSAFLYMEHMPYISRLWFGEYFEYDLGPDYWLTEVSGIPFGLTGEMLEGGGHPFRGMVYGMTSRIYGNIDMRPMWKLFDDFGIADSEMLGYWVDRSPIKTNTPGIRSTIYLKEDKIMIAIGSWAENKSFVRLVVDWKALGMNKENLRLFSPAIKGLQAYEEFDLDKPIPVNSQEGLILIMK